MAHIFEKSLQVVRHKGFEKVGKGWYQLMNDLRISNTRRLIRHGDGSRIIPLTKTLHTVMAIESFFHS